MPDVKQLDPFKPQQPSIPGVAPRPASAAPDPAPAPDSGVAPAEPNAPQPKTKLIVVAVAGMLLLLIVLIYWGRSASRKTVPVTTETAVEEPAPVAAPRPQASQPTGPGVIGTVSELAKPWASKNFQYRNYVSGQLEPALVVHLPRGEYWGFSLIEPFGNCQLEFVTDLDKLKSDYGYRADHPMVTNPCNRTVYDLLRYGGGASSDDLVRGVVVQGNGLRPPMAIEIKVHGSTIVAGRSE
jgi:hypothetical protein